MIDSQGRQPYPHPYAHPPHPQPQPHLPQPPAVPEAIGDFRRWFSATVDGLVALFGGMAIAVRLIPAVGGPEPFWGTILAGVFGLSFLHHVLGPWIFRTTIGKFLFFARVVRDADGGRPRFWQAVRRWAYGLTWLPMQPLLSLFGDDGDPYEDACGLRYVRARDLRR
ncbi:RDD family protein [Streptomyces sp. NBS 14/10]|uniref:RDD family protein n=1 Tax=Streptomyces sp. NBS 14/10 TaxID=1945643 RepID=UPI000B7F9D06|nr:RDD family protein [Streptomyces sp. NBS 14/10]KAK1181427.1 RDD family protein [Streptomyces sp. NBS 14/10]